MHDGEKSKMFKKILNQIWNFITQAILHHWRLRDKATRSGFWLYDDLAKWWPPKSNVYLLKTKRDWQSKAGKVLGVWQHPCFPSCPQFFPQAVRVSLLRSSHSFSFTSCLAELALYQVVRFIHDMTSQSEWSLFRTRGHFKSFVLTLSAPWTILFLKLVGSFHQYSTLDFFISIYQQLLFEFGWNLNNYNFIPSCLNYVRFIVRSQYRTENIFVCWLS